MKLFFLLSFIAFNIFASAPRGIFHCVKGNEESICDQKIKSFETGGVITALSVEYVGWCGSQGPFVYPCSGNTCSDAQIEITLKDDRSYHWKNLDYDFYCDFEKI